MTQLGEPIMLDWLRSLDDLNYVRIQAIAKSHL